MTFNHVDRVYIDLDDREKYSTNSGLASLSPFFAQKSNAELFLFAIAFALKNGLPRKPIAKREGFFLITYLKDVDEMYLKSLAVYERKSIEVLENEKEILTIAEEYANAGIKALYHALKSRCGSFTLDIEDYLLNDVELPTHSHSEL